MQQIASLMSKGHTWGTTAIKEAMQKSSTIIQAVHETAQNLSVSATIQAQSTLNAAAKKSLIIAQYGYVQGSEAFKQALQKGSALIQAIPEATRTFSAGATAQTQVALNAAAEKSLSIARHCVQLAQRAASLPEIAKNVVQTHPKKSLSIGIAITAYLIGQTQLAKRVSFSVQQKLLYSMLSSRHLPCVRWALANGADIDHIYSDGKRALHKAAERGQAHIVQFFIEQGANQGYASNGYMPLYYAIQSGNKATMHYLLCRQDSSDYDTQKQLTDAAAHGNLDFVRCAIQHGSPYKFTVQNADGRAFSLTEWAHQTLVSPYLRQLEPAPHDHLESRMLRDAIEEHNNIKAKLAISNHAHLVDADDSSSALHHAIIAINNVAHFTKAATEIVTALIKAGAPLHKKDTNGNTPLHLAVQEKDEEIISLLLEHGSTMDTHNNAGQNPTDIALAKCQETLAAGNKQGAGTFLQLLDNFKFPTDHAQRELYERLQETILSN